MINDTLFEIPVYSCNQEQFTARVTATVDRYMSKVIGKGSEIWRQQRNDEIQRHLYPVRYNELIGAIEVHRLGTQLRADYWFAAKSRIVIGSKQRARIRWIGKLLEKEYGHSGKPSSEIFTDFRKALTRAIQGDRSLKDRCVDLTAFDRCGPFVDWRAVLELRPSDG